MRIFYFVSIISLISIITIPVFAQLAPSTGDVAVKKPVTNALQPKPTSFNNAPQASGNRFGMSKQEYKAALEKSMKEAEEQFDLMDKNHDGIVGNDEAPSDSAYDNTEPKETPKPAQNNTQPKANIKPLTGVAPIGR